MYQNQLATRPPPPFRGSLKALEADIQHANTLADAIRRAYGGACLQMKLSYSPLAPLYFYLMRWLDCTCSYMIPSYFGLLQVLVFKVYVDGTRTVTSYERRASLKEFYAVIYPSLQLLESNMVRKEDAKERSRSQDIYGRKRIDEWRKPSDIDREDECGICMEICTKMVLPNCNHAMCINCFRDWSTRSESCPFCRGSLKRVHSRDLWVLTNNGDIIDTVTVEKENVKHFYHFIDNLPLAIPDSLFSVYYDYLF